MIHLSNITLDRQKVTSRRLLFHPDAHSHLSHLSTLIFDIRKNSIFDTIVTI